MKIIIPGGSGQVGKLLASHFHKQGHDVCVLSRSPHPAPWKVAQWNAQTRGDWEALIAQSDVLINLTGRSVNCRYNAENRRQIYDSRINSTNLLNQVVATLARPPKVWINASTATIYRHSLDRPMGESDGELGGNEPNAPDTWNFSIDVAKAWERAFFATPTPATRKIAIRSAITFSAGGGGAFDILSTLVRRGLGGSQGSGNQFVSWIHQTDFVRAIDLLIAREEFSGMVNVCAPNPLPNREFMRALRNAWGMKAGLPAPGWLIEIGAFLMRTESELVMKSRQVVPQRLLEAGFTFEFPHWPQAAFDLVQLFRIS